VKPRPLEVVMTDGAVLRGVRWPGADDGLVLVHDVGQDVDAWRPLVGPVVEAGFGIAAVDLRGHGASDGTWDPLRLDSDLQAIAAAARQAFGRRLAMGSAGLTGLAVLRLGFSPRPDAVILFSPGPLVNGEARQLRGEGISKLFLVGAEDRQRDAAVLELRNHSIGNAAIVSFPTRAQGTDLLNQDHQRQATEKILAFLREVRSVSEEAGA
jgi:alpha-beta hydrolase superfamily lysophospholipase